VHYKCFDNEDDHHHHHHDHHDHDYHHRDDHHDHDHHRRRHHRHHDDDVLCIFSIVTYLKASIIIQSSVYHTPLVCKSIMM